MYYSTLIEFAALDKQLDELNGVLDALEAKNDDIHGKLKELLESSRQERLKMANSDDNSDDTQDIGSSSTINQTQNNAPST